VKKIGPRPRRRSGAKSDSIAFLIGRAYYNYAGLLERKLAELGLDQYLAVGSGPVLFALFEVDDCIIKDLVRRVRISPSTLTGTLERLKRSGIIETRRDAVDGRAWRIKLTPLGRSLEPKCRVLLRRLELVLHRGMSEKEARTLRDLLDRTIENLRQPDLPAATHRRKSPPTRLTHRNDAIDTHSRL
jgi:MarR family transcriptional regulator, organic hydroperoxide resistance regulator